MSDKLLLLVPVVGLSIYLMRLIPLALTSRRLAATSELPPRVKGFLSSVGPSFIAVFLVYSILPASGSIQPLQVALKIGGLVPVPFIYLKTGNLGTAGLAGLACYGILFFAQQ